MSLIDVLFPRMAPEPQGARVVRFDLAVTSEADRQRKRENYLRDRERIKARALERYHRRKA